MKAELPKGWLDGIPPKKGRYLVVDYPYWIYRLGDWQPDLDSWFIQNRKVPRTSIAMWRPLPELPPEPKKE